LLASKEAEELKEHEWVFDDHFRFLDSAETSQKVAFTSMPGSGELTLRNLIEKVSGLSTGSTVSLNTSTQHQCLGEKGEAITDDRVWIVKTHHPGMTSKGLHFDANKVLCLVRNPLDVIENYAN